MTRYCKFDCRYLFAALLPILVGAMPLRAQQIAVPRNPTPQQAADPAMKSFDLQHLKDIPYSGSLPAPLFPSTPRVQRTFTVSYVYDYAYSTYQPAVAMPIVSTLQAKKDTPESALVGIQSALRTGNYEAFLDCLDDTTRARQKQMVLDKKFDIPGWQKAMKEYFGNHAYLLIDRVETAGYVILNTRLEGGSGTGTIPNTFKLVNGKWLATNDLGDKADQMLMSFKPNMAGLIYHEQPEPVGKMNPLLTQQRDAQADFLKYHDTRTTIAHAAE